jgi:hypothetical protein
LSIYFLSLYITTLIKRLKRERRDKEKKKGKLTVNEKNGVNEHECDANDLNETHGRYIQGIKHCTAKT